MLKNASQDQKKAHSHTVRTQVPALSGARGSSLQCRVVCSSSLGRLLTGTWHRQNINKFPVVGWQAGRYGAVPLCYRTCTALLSSAWHCMLRSAAKSFAQQILTAQVLSAIFQEAKRPPHASPPTYLFTFNPSS